MALHAPPAVAIVSTFTSDSHNRSHRDDFRAWAGLELLH
jgi:hypothetical protein